jgi:hypothetical protein
MFHEKKKKTRDSKGSLRRGDEKIDKSETDRQEKARPETKNFLHSFIFALLVKKSTEKNINYDAVLGARWSARE